LPGRGSRRDPPVIILLADDVVLAEIGPVLHFDDDHRLPSVILDPVPRLSRDHRALSRPKGELPVPPHDRRSARDHHPVFGTVPVLLQAEPLTRLDDQALDLVSRTLLERAETPPRLGDKLQRPASRSFGVRH
jgi:hypothetical protein